MLPASFTQRSHNLIHKNRGRVPRFLYFEPWNTACAGIEKSFFRNFFSKGAAERSLPLLKNKFFSSLALPRGEVARLFVVTERATHKKSPRSLWGICISYNLNFKSPVCHGWISLPPSIEPWHEPALPENEPLLPCFAVPAVFLPLLPLPALHVPHQYPPAAWQNP
jgi:hypothetical protein